MLGVYTSQLLAVIACFLASRFIRSLPFEVSPLDPLTSVVLTLALGIGTSTAIFSVCNAVLFRPLPDPQPNRLVMLWERMSRDRKLTPVAPANFVDWREENRSFERLAAVNPLLDLTLTGRGDSERVVAAAASADLFPLLGTRMATGRGFSTDDDRPGHDHVTVISDAFCCRLPACTKGGSNRSDQCTEIRMIAARRSGNPRAAIVESADGSFARAGAASACFDPRSHARTRPSRNDPVE